MLKPGDRVRRKTTGDQGVVATVHGTGMVSVVFPDGKFLVSADELERIYDDPTEQLLEGMITSAVPYALRLQALYLRHAYRYDPLAGLSNARIEPTPHQIYVGHRVVNKLRPRMILADEVGLGKTIEAGLIIKELTARELIERVLIIVPASLQQQWQHELQSKFNERFEIIDGPSARFLARTGDNPWAKHHRVICSINLAANRKHADNIAAVDWDVVVFDEAHRVRRSQQTAGRIQTTLAYDLADELKETATGLLLLSATPMQLHPYELYSLIELVEPGLFADFDDYDRRRAELPGLNRIMRTLREWEGLSDAERRKAVDNVGRQVLQLSGRDQKDPSALLADPTFRQHLMDALTAEHPLTEVLARNRKAEVGGFTPRHAQSFMVDFTPDEMELYEDVSEYIRQGYERSQQEKRYAVGFLMVLYQRLLTSSSMAVRTSFKRRIAKLELRVLDLREARDAPAPTFDEEDLADLRDWEEPTLSMEELEQMAIDEANLEFEIDELQVLVDRLGKNRDSKAKELVRGIRSIFTEAPDEKVLVFTQYIETQLFLAATLRANGFESVVFNGSMTADNKEAAVRAFRGQTPIMISTEAGGEGRNFQFCHIVFNYDLPWNPMKVEQRIGRLDRIGQKKAVYIYNLAARDTVEERILDVLERRIGLFEESVGSLDPILGELETDIEKIVLGQAGHYGDAFEELGERIEEKVRRARDAERVMADFILDRASFRRDVTNQLLERRPMATHQDLRRFLTDCLAYYGGRLDDHPDGGSVIALSPRLAARVQTRELVTHGAFDWKLALEREDLPFLAMGQELVDQVVGLPLEEGAAAGIRRLDDAPEGVSLEAFYEVQSEGFARSGIVIRHLVTPNLSVASAIMKDMPDPGHTTDMIEIPDWVPDGLTASRTQFEAELAAQRARITIEHERLQAEELARADRIHDYRRARLERIIGDEEEWIAAAEEFGSDRDRRILPARRGKLAKNRERRARLDADHEQEVEKLRGRTSGAAARILAVGLVVGQ